MLRELRPADLATTVEELPPSRRSQIAAALDDEELADLLEEMPEQDQVRPASGSSAAPTWWRRSSRTTPRTCWPCGGDELRAGLSSWLSTGRS
jgi:hypothetical protein